MRQLNRSPWTVPVCLAAILALAGIAAAPAQDTPSRVQTLAPLSPDPVLLEDGVIVDAARGVAYVMDQEARLGAVRTSDGSVLWRSPEAAKPLLVSGDLLVAQAEAGASGELPVVVLDRASGAVTARASVELPRDVRATVSDGPRTSFRVSAAPADGRVLLSWEARRTRKELQGYVPAPSEGRAPGAEAASLETRRRTERLQGTTMLDLGTGAVDTATKAAAVAPVPAAPALRTFDGLADVPGRKFLSADGRHVLVSRLVDPRRVLERYRWTVYTRGGELLGEVPGERSAAPFVVAGSRLIVQAEAHAVHESGERGEGGEGGTTTGQPLRLRAFDLASGTEAWAQPIQRVEFAGPFPP